MNFGLRRQREGAANLKAMLPLPLATQVFNAGADTIHVAEASVSIEPAKNGVVVSAVAAIDLAPGSSLPIEVTWTPVTPLSLDVTLVVSTESRRLTARLKGHSPP